MSNVLYVKLREITEAECTRIFLKDVAELYCRDKEVERMCGQILVKEISAPTRHRYVISALEVIQKIQQAQPQVQVNNVGSMDFIIAYAPPSHPWMGWEKLKTGLVCALSFFGGAFAIMTFNNDANVPSVFQELYALVMGEPPQGPTVLDLSYSLGLALGILVFFNHFAGWKINTDPTPLEVEMCLYEDNISKTLIDRSGRKERKIDRT